AVGSSVAGRAFAASGGAENWSARWDFLPGTRRGRSPPPRGSRGRVRWGRGSSGAARRGGGRGSRAPTGGGRSPRGASTRAGGVQRPDRLGARRRPLGDRHGALSLLRRRSARAGGREPWGEARSGALSLRSDGARTGDGPRGPARR